MLVEVHRGGKEKNRWPWILSRAAPGPGEPAEALHEQREWLRVTLSSIGDAVITTDTQGRVTFLNPVAQSITGWNLEDAAGTPLEIVFKIINEETRRTVENPATRALREGVVVGLANHTLLIARDGAERPIDDSAAPIRNARGEIAGVVLVFRDVTERRQQEHALLDALRYTENILSTLHESLIVLDSDFRIKTANRTFYRTFNATPEVTEGKLIFDLGNRQWDIPALRMLLEKILPQNHEIRDFEVKYDFPKIGRKIMLLNARRLREDGDSTELMLLAIEDITERRRAEEAVHDSELRYRRLFETARDGILILDAEAGKIIDANPFMTEMLGYPAGELIGKELWEIGLLGDRESSRTAFRELQERGEIRYENLPLETKTGKRAEVEFVSNVYRVDGHSVIQCNIRDITERRQLDRAKVQTEVLADLHRRKDEFLAMLSHELRNPLAPIVNAVQLLSLEPEHEGPLQHQARTIIERQVGVLKVLVDDLLEVSRITSGRIRLHQEDVDLRAIVNTAVESVRPLIDQRRHQFSVTQTSDAVWIHADPVRIEQVVVNLLTNAAKYTDAGGRIWLTVELAGHEVVLRVRDTGVGIAPELLPRVFELFTQGERSLDRSQGGLGIGLTVVKKLVEMHRGRIEVFSALGQGSEFVVRLPLLERHRPAPALTTAKPVKRAAHQLRILVVDDNADQADSIVLLLQHAGHEVHVAYSGTAALMAASEFAPDMVLLDIGLPEIDGYEVARRLRQNPELKRIRLVALSGYGQEADRHRSQAAGFDLHLVKPVDYQKLQECLTALQSPRTDTGQSI